MSAKWSVTSLIGDHLDTLKDQRTNQIRIWDILTFYGIPILLGAICLFLNFRMRDPASILAGIAVFTGLLFGLLIHVFTLGLRITDDIRISNQDRTARLIDELQANVGYSVLVGIVTTSLLILAAATTEKDMPIGSPLSAAISALLSHLMLTVFMALKRTRAAYSAMRF